MNKPLKTWMTLASGEQQVRLAKLAGTSVGMLRQLVTGNRSASSALAIRIEKASEKLLEMPTLNRMDLNPTCRACDYAKRCTKERS